MNNLMCMCVKVLLRIRSLYMYKHIRSMYHTCISCMCVHIYICVATVCCYMLYSILSQSGISYILYFSCNLSHATMSTLLVRFDGKFFKCQPPPQPKRYAKEPFPCRAGEDPWSRLARIEHCSIWTYI